MELFSEISNKMAMVSIVIAIETQSPEKLAMMWSFYLELPDNLVEYQYVRHTLLTSFCDSHHRDDHTEDQNDFRRHTSATQFGHNEETAVCTMLKPIPKARELTCFT